MARNVITHFTLARETRVRVAKADGDCMFLAGGKVYENGRYDGKWHKFPEGTRFELCAAVDKTDTYLLLAKEKTVTVTKDEEGNEKKTSKTELIPVFLRRMSFEKLCAAAAVDVVAEAPPEDVDFGTPLVDVETSAPTAEDAELDALVAEVEEEELREEEGPSDADLAEIELELAAG